MAFAAFGHGGGGGTGTTAALRRNTGVVLLLLAPGLAYLALFFLTPLVSLLLTSMQAHQVVFDRGEAVTVSGLETYYLQAIQYWPQFLRSFAFALAATVLALLIGYPIAYFIGVTARRWPLIQAISLVLVIAPFFISFLLRTLAWQQIFAKEGPVTGFFQLIGLLPDTAGILGSPGAVIFGLTYNFIPFMTLPLYTSLERLDVRYLEAGSDLYASPATTFWKVTLPLSMPGVVSGTLLTFIPAAGDYINAAPEYLGGTQVAMIGNVIQEKFLGGAQEVQLASAISAVLMAVILIVVAVYVRRSGTEELL